MFLFVVVTLACNLLTPKTLFSPESSPTPVSSAQTQPAPIAPLPVTPTNASVPTIRPTSTTTAPSPSPSDLNCIPSQDSISFPTVDYANSPEVVLDFLNRGGTLHNLDSGLYAAGIASQPVAVTATDLTGDGKQDVIISVYDPASPSLPPSGRLTIYTCSDGEYQQALSAGGDEGWGAPIVRYLQDLNGVGVPEVVITSATCGAHTCFEDAMIMSWNGYEFGDRLKGETVDLPYPDIRVVDPDGDGIYDLEVAGGGFASVGAGPQRTLTRRWSFDANSNNWTLSKLVLAPSNYRIHVLHDAEEAAWEAHYDRALAAYARVVEDASLLEWMNPKPERANLAAYALYKMAVVYLIQGKSDQAQASFDRLVAEYSPGEIGHAYVELAQVFQSTYPAGGVGNGCAAVQNYAANHTEQVLVPLGSAVYGYANRDFTPENLCPWR